MELEAPAAVSVDGDEGKVETVMEEDMADVEVEERRRLQAEADKLYEARSSVLKRSDLPRPVGAIPDNEETKNSSHTENMSEAIAEALIDEERLTLLKHDAFAHPVEALASAINSSSVEKKTKKNH